MKQYYHLFEGVYCFKFPLYFQEIVFLYFSLIFQRLWVWLKGIHIMWDYISDVLI